MTIWFCLDCFATVDEGAGTCARCGSSLQVPGRTYEQKLIRALSHPLRDRRLMAAEILGKLRSQAATERLAEISLDGSDPYLQAEAVRALAAIDPEHGVIRRLKEGGPVLAQAAAREGRAGP
jgi:HEAT repeat protein